MQSDPDAMLLRRYVAEGDEKAFAEFVRRRIDGVYAAALRRVGGDTHLAQDVTQQVFVALARRASALVDHPDITGWLYTTTRHHAANLVRAERRRKTRELKAHTMHEVSSGSPPAPDWSRVAPVLDDAIERLGTADRATILLRFVERRAFAEIGAMLGVSEDAARMRADRALDKLRGQLERRHVTSSSAALAAALASQAAVAAPAGLAATVSSAALAGGVAASGVGAVAEILIMTKIKIGIAAAIVLAGAGWAVRDVQAGRALSDEIRHLQLRSGSSEIAALRKANEKLAEVVADASPASPDTVELKTIRQRIAQLKARPEGVLDSAMKPMAALVNRGWDEPTAACETLYWTRANNNADEFAKSYGWTAAGKAKLDRFFAALPEAVRVSYGSPERMLALEDMKWGPVGAPAAVQILGQTAYGDKALVHAWGRLASGQEVNMAILLQRYEGGWAVPFTDQMVDRAIAALDPATGKRWVKSDPQSGAAR